MKTIAQPRFKVLPQHGGISLVYDNLLQKVSSEHDSVTSAYFRAYTLNQFGEAL